MIALRPMGSSVLRPSLDDPHIFYKPDSSAITYSAARLELAGYASVR